MPSYGSTGLRTATYLVVVACYLALVTVPEIGLGALLPPLLILPLAPIGEWLDRRYQLYRRITSAVSLLCLLALPAWVMWYGALNAVTLLIIYIQAYLLAHVKLPRHYYQIFLMSFFLLVSACVRTPEAGIALVLGLFLICCVWAFFLLELAKATNTNRRLVEPDLMPLDRRTPLGLPESSRFNRGVTVSAVAMSVAAIGLTVLLFFATPRMEAGLLGRDDMTSVARTGLDKSVMLAGGQRIVGDPSPVMRVAFPDDPEGIEDGMLYWRKTSLDYYTGAGWERIGIHSGWATDDAPKFAPENRHDRRLARHRMYPNAPLIRQDIYMTETPRDGIPVLDKPLFIEARAARLDWATGMDGTALVLRNKQSNFQCEAVSELYLPGAAVLEQAPSNYETTIPIQHYRYLIQQDLQPRTFELVKELTAEAESVYEKVIAIQRYLEQEGQFFYSMNSPSLPVENPVDHFIWETKTGHCELYASAMALMLRSLGIPTRVVTGYRGGDYDADDEAYIVRADMAHLWVEVYFIGVGWVRFDPSPASSLDDLTMMGRFQRFVSTLMLKGQILWYQNVVGFESGFRLDQLRNLQFSAITNPLKEVWAEGIFPDSDLRRGYGYWVRTVAAPALLLVLALMAVLYLLRGRLSARQHILTPDQVRAVRVYTRLCRAMRKRGINTVNRTPREILEDAARLPGVDAAEVAAVIDTYSKVRFGGRPFGPEDSANWRRRATAAFSQN